MNDLEKIDAIRSRLGISFKEAKEALDKYDGDVVKALIALEEKGIKWEDKFKVQANKIMNRAKELIKEGNVTRIKVKKEGKTIVEIPGTLGAAGVIAALLWTPLTIATGIGTVAAVYNKYKLEIERKDGEIIEEDID